MADLSGGGSGLLARDSKGKNAARLVTRIDPGVVLLVVPEIFWLFKLEYDAELILGRCWAIRPSEALKVVSTGTVTVVNPATMNRAGVLDQSADPRLCRRPLRPAQAQQVGPPAQGRHQGTHVGNIGLNSSSASAFPVDPGR